MKSFKFTSFGKEYSFETLEELSEYVVKNDIDTSFALYEFDKMNSTYKNIGEIKEWIK